MKFINTFKKILLSAVIAATAMSCGPRDRFITITGFAQGGTYTVKLNLNGSDGMVIPEPEEIKDSVDAILVRIDKSLSGYNKKSLLSRFNAGETIYPDSIFIDIYNHGYAFYTETGGIVDVASAPLFDIWGFGFQSGEMPSDERIAQTMKECGLKRMRADMRGSLMEDGSIDGKAMLTEMPGNKGSEDPALPQLNYNAIAQGYSCDLVAGYLYSIGVKDMMVDIGEIFCDGLNPSGKPWSIGIDKPVDGNNEPGAQMQGIFRAPAGGHGIVTSGNYRKFYVRDGKKFAHTIDPRTGYPVNHSLLSATIVAPDALTADAYATYCMAIGLEEAKKFLTSRPDLEGCLVYDDNGSFKTWCSEGFTLEEI